MYRPPRTLSALFAVLALVFTAACGDVETASTPTGAQSALPPPVTAATDEPAAPVALVVGDVRAPVDPVATDAAGVLLPPQDVTRLGWWADSALPGRGAGTVVVTGHVDDVDQGVGYAARFADLAVGDVVEAVTADHTVHRYRVTESLRTGKDAGADDGLPVDELNRLDGPETLALVTCGGPFVGPPLGYRDNVVVFARP